MVNPNYSVVKKPFLFLLLAVFLLFQSCHSYRVVSKGDTEDLVATKKTMWTFAWGLVQEKDFRVCADTESIDQVHVKTNLGYILLSAATAGIVVPVRIECYCAKKKLGTSVIPTNN